LFPIVNFLKCVVTEVDLFSLVAFTTLTFHKVVWRHTWGVVGSLVTVLLQMFSLFRQWNKFEKRSTFDKVKAYEVKAYKKCASFWATLCYECHYHGGEMGRVIHAWTGLSHCCLLDRVLFD